MRFQEIWHTTFLAHGTSVEVFLNPDSKDLLGKNSKFVAKSLTNQNMYEVTGRGLLSIKNDDLYVWDGIISHLDMIQNLNLNHPDLELITFEISGEFKNLGSLIVTNTANAFLYIPIHEAIDIMNNSKRINQMSTTFFNQTIIT